MNLRAPPDPKEKVASGTTTEATLQADQITYQNISTCCGCGANFRMSPRAAQQFCPVCARWVPIGRHLAAIRALLDAVP
jgi:hypothetical protein